MSDPHDPITPIQPQMPHSSSGGLIKKVALTIAGLLFLAVITVVAVTHLDGSHTTHHAAASASSPSAASSTRGGDVADRPNGCVGGTDAPNAISAAFSEPITTKGAVEFTATMMRWLWSSDVDSTQMTSVGPRLASPMIISHFTQVKNKFSSGTTSIFSTKEATAWVKTFDFNKGTAQVYFQGQGIVSTTSSETVDAVSVVNLTVKDGHWFMAFSGKGDLGSSNSAFNTITAQIAAHGGPLSGGC